jgi:hypothetical protein
MLYRLAKFRTTIVKPFYIEEKLDRAEPIPEPSQLLPLLLIRIRPVILILLKTREQLEKPSPHDTFLTRKEESDLELTYTMRASRKITAPEELFEELIQTEIDSLIARGVFEFVRFDPNIYRGRLFRSRIVNEVKGKTTNSLYEKTRLMI